MSLALLTDRPKAPPSPGWMALVKAVERLSTADDLAAIIEIIRATARDICGADGVCFVLRDGELCHYVEEYAIGPLWKGKRFPLTACISGWCMLNDRAAVIPDIYQDPRIPHDAYRPTFVKSLVMVPVRTTEPIAAIGCYWANTREFSEDDIALLDGLARSTSAAIAAAKLRETLRDREHRLAMALEAGGLGAWELDLVGGTLTTTPACKAMFGREPDEAFSADALLEAIHPDDRVAARRVLSSGPQPSLDTEYRILMPGGGEHRIEMRGRTILDATGRPVMLAGVVRDVTELHRAKERIESLRTEIVRNARLNDLGQMASALAHELNQPLAAAGNYLHAAERLLDKNAAQALAAIGKAEAQFERSKEIIQRIRDFVGNRASARRPEELRATIDEIIELARTNPRWRSIPVAVEIEEGLKADIDKVQIQQVLLNLLRNAYEAVEPCAGRKVIVSARRIEGRIEIRMRDNGPGLTPEICEHLFQPFHTTKSGGMGVGLSLCRKIVEAHEGRMWHEKVEPGATFCFTVPAAD